MTDGPPHDPPLTPDLATTEWGAIDKREVLDYDADRGAYLASFDSERESIREVVVAVIAVVSETPPLELPSLSRVLEADAVERLVEAAVTDPADGDVHVSFTYTGWDVTVHSYGIIAVRPHQEEPPD